MTYQLVGKHIISGQIKCISGLHIGGTTTGVEIGGVDNPVIKDPITDQPYIPGSGLKGKLRSLTEWSLGMIEKHSKHQDSYTAYDCRELEITPPPNPGDPSFERYSKALTVGRLFGAANDKPEVRIAAGPTRLTVRDSFLTPASQKELEDILGKGLFTEVKTENTLDRVTSAANPRPMERVPAGSAFQFTFILDIYQTVDQDLLRELFAAMRLLEHSSLGGSGSRGHGQVKFEAINITWRSLDHYRRGVEEKLVGLPDQSLESFIKDYEQIKWPI